MIKHCFCYCLYGRDPIYYEPLRIVADRLMSWPDTLIFIGTISSDYAFVSSYYLDNPNVKVFSFSKFYSNRERMLRFLAPSYIRSENYHYRDSDSVCSDFELLLIYTYHSLHYPALILRNHPLHFSPIMAGMFSLRLDFANKLVSLVNKNWNTIDTKCYYDQNFLTKYLYETVKSSALVLSSHYLFSGEVARKLSFDKFDFIGKPSFWSEKECTDAIKHDYVFSPAHLIRLPFYFLLRRLYQRGRFVRLLTIFCGKKVGDR